MSKLPKAVEALEVNLPLQHTMLPIIALINPATAAITPKTPTMMGIPVFTKLLCPPPPAVSVVVAVYAW